MMNEQIFYTIPQLSERLPGVSEDRIRGWVADKKVRSIPQGVIHKYEVIPHVTLIEDLKSLVEEWDI